MLTAGALLRLLTFNLEASLSVQWLPQLSVSGDSGRVFAVVLGVLLDLAAWMVALKLGVEALLDAAQDRARAGGEGWQLASDRHALGQIAVALVLLLPALLVAWLGNLAGAWLVLVLAFVAWPAAAILDAMDENLGHALNPLAWASLLRRLDGAYLAALGGLALLLAAWLSLRWIAFAVLAPMVAAASSRFVACYALLVAFRALGLLLLHRHEVLGLDVSPPIAQPLLANAEEDEVMQRAQFLLGEGEPAQAADALQALIRRRGASAPIHERYRHLLLEAGDRFRLVEHAREYVGNLLALGKRKQALALAAESLRGDRDFRPLSDEDTTQLITLAADAGHSQLAMDLAADFPAHFPKSPDIPRNALLAASLLAQRFGRVDEARQRLRALAERYPDHALAPEFAKALAALDVDSVR